MTAIIDRRPRSAARRTVVPTASSPSLATICSLATAAMAAACSGSAITSRSAACQPVHRSGGHEPAVHPVAARARRGRRHPRRPPARRQRPPRRAPPERRRCRRPAPTFDGSATTAAAANASSTPRRGCLPRNSTRSATPSSAASCSRSARRGPSPTTRTLASGSPTIALSSTSTPFFSTSRPTISDPARPPVGECRSPRAMASKSKPIGTGLGDLAAELAQFGRRWPR